MKASSLHLFNGDSIDQINTQISLLNATIQTIAAQNKWIVISGPSITSGYAHIAIRKSSTGESNSFSNAYNSYSGDRSLVKYFNGSYFVSATDGVPPLASNATVIIQVLPSILSVGDYYQCKWISGSDTSDTSIQSSWSTGRFMSDGSAETLSLARRISSIEGQLDGLETALESRL